MIQSQRVHNQSKRTLQALLPNFVICLVLASPGILQAASTPPESYQEPSSVTLHHIPYSRVDMSNVDGPNQVGVGIELTDSERFVSFGDLHWQRHPSGHYSATIAYTVEQAMALRLALNLANFPKKLTVKFVNSNPTKAYHEVSLDYAKVSEYLNRDIPIYWSPPNSGDTLYIELNYPDIKEAEFVTHRIELPAISYLFAKGPWNLETRRKTASVDSGSKDFATAKAQVETNCIKDVSCQTPSISSTAKENFSRATGYLLITNSRGEDYHCTGHLIEDSDTNTELPYMLTAKHCIFTSSEASSVSVYWDYRSSEPCEGERGGDVEFVNISNSTVGSEVLKTSPGQDWTLLILGSKDNPADLPDYRYFLRWDSSELTEGTTLHHIGHSKGNPQSYARGIVRNPNLLERSLLVAVPLLRDYFSRPGSILPIISIRYNPNIRAIDWENGHYVAPGSSGSVLVRIDHDDLYARTGGLSAQANFSNACNLNDEYHSTYFVTPSSSVHPHISEYLDSMPTEDDENMVTPNRPTSISNFSAQPTSIPETAGISTITLRLNHAIPSDDPDLTFSYTIGGENISSDDIVGSLSGNIVVPAGSNIGTLTIVAQLDTIAEGSGETLTISLDSPLPNNADGTQLTETGINPIQIAITEVIVLLDLSSGSAEITGNINPEGNIDFFQFTLSRAARVTAYASGTLNTFGALLDSDSILASDNINGVSNFRIEHDVSPGTYYISVGSADSNTGNYRLHVRTVNAPTNPPMTPRPAPIPPSSGDICSRTPQVKEAILAIVQASRRAAVCGDVTTTELATITRLYLARRSINSLNENDFDGLTSLTWLSLDGHDLTELPSSVFDGLTSLSWLYLTNNDLTELPPGVFGGLTSLTGLRLNNNDLAELLPGVFGGLTSLSWLSLTNNDLTELPSGVFGGLTSLTQLSLAANDLTELPPGVFGDLTSLTRLHLGDNDLTELLSGVFDGLTSLTRLYLSANDLTELPSGVFGGLTSLTFLYLIGNDLTDLPPGVFDDLTSLTWLHLNGNDLTELLSGVFGGLTSLTQLHLYDNDLTGLPSGVFGGLTSLIVLRLDGNGLTELPSGVFGGLTSLSWLSLTNNDLTELPSGVFDSLTSLTLLHLNDNDLTELPSGVFDGLISLTGLHLNDNDLTELPSGVFDGLTSLTRLHLNDNDLIELPSGVFDGLTSLTRLHLNDNDLTELPAGIFDDVLDSLAFLSVDDALKGRVSIEPLVANIAPGITQTLTVQLTKALLATVRFPIIAGNAEASNIIPPTPATVTIPAGMTSATFDITLAAEAAAGSIGTVTLSTPVFLYTDTLGNTRANTEPNVVFSLVNPLNAAANTHTLTATQPLGTVNICSRTPEVETAIILQITETNCAAVPQTQLNTVTMLDLSGTETEFDSDINIPVLNSIPPLKTGDFSNLPNLQTLNLFGNDLTSLPENIFDGLLNLQTLNLENNDLTSSLHENVFDGLSNLRELNLESNGLTSPLHENIFNGLSNLQDLDLENNDLALLPENIFRGLSNLQELDMDDNNLTSPLHENTFNDLSNLQDLDLENNDLTLLPENIFDGLSSLQELDLRNNNLISLPIGIFNDTLGTLTELRLDDTLRSAVSIEPRPASIMPGTIQTLTAQLTGTLPSTMRLTVTKTDNITAPTTVTIPAGMTSATFDIALATETAISNAGTVTLITPVLLYTDTLGNTRANTKSNVVFSLVNPLDAAANTFTFIAPDTTAGYDSTADITITEGGGTAASAKRTLTLGYAPHAQATVSFELTGGTLGVRSVVTNHDLIFTVGDGETDPAVGTNGMTNGRFNIPAGTTSIILTFKAIADTDGDDETITFRITGIEFAGSGTATDIPTAALPSRLTIRITDAGADAIVIVDGDDTSISELLPGSTGESAVIRVKLTNIPSTVTSAVIGFTLGATATRGTDYTVTLAGSSTAADSVTITDADIAGTAPDVPQGGARGSAEATLTFHALNDSADIENENIVLTINSVTFDGAPASNLTSTDIAGSSQTITITDRPTSPRAIISVGEAKITEGDGLSENPNFRITFVNIDPSTPGATGMVNYTFDDGFSAAASPDTLDCADGAGKYCAFSSISNSLAGLTNNTGSFSFTASSISGVSAEISIFILPREDPDAEDETVELTVNSITVQQSGGTLTFNMANGNLVNNNNDPTDKVRITIADDALRLRIRVFLESTMH